MPDRPKVFRAKSAYNSRVALRNETRAFRRFKLSILSAEPLCRYCQADGRITAGTVVDHIICLALGGTDDPTNLAPSCVNCNTAKSIDEKRFIGRGYDARDVCGDPALARWLEKAARYHGSKKDDPLLADLNAPD